jgi:hypothetical protein
MAAIGWEAEGRTAGDFDLSVATLCALSIAAPFVAASMTPDTVGIATHNAQTSRLSLQTVVRFWVRRGNDHEPVSEAMIIAQRRETLPDFIVVYVGFETPIRE